MTWRRLNLLIVPAWYPNQSNPLSGIFIAEQAQLLAQIHNVAVLFPFEPEIGFEPSSGNLAATRPLPHKRNFRPTTQAQIEADTGLLTVRLPARRPNLSGRSTLFGSAAAIADGLEALKEVGFTPDIAHTHVYSAAAALRLAQTVSNLPRSSFAPRDVATKVPYLTTEHYSGIALGDVHKNSVNSRIARFGYNGAALITPTSSNLELRINQLGVKPQVKVIPSAVDTEKFSLRLLAQPISGRNPRLLLIGNLVPVKGIPLAIDAMRQIVRTYPAATLQIAGTGPDEQALRQQVIELGLSNNITLIGRQTREQIAELMQTADLLVAPSYTENLPNVQLEAMASGLPIVSTQAGGMPDIVSEQVGLLVPTGDSPALAEAILSMLLRIETFDPQKIRLQAVDRFSRERVLKLLDYEYQRLTK